jgi:hypothetical protein
MPVAAFVSRATANYVGAGVSSTLTVTGVTAAVGQFIAVWAGKSANASTTDGLTATDSGGNTYTQQAFLAHITDAGTAPGTRWLYLLTAPVTTALTGGTVTITLPVALIHIHATVEVYSGVVSVEQASVVNRPDGNYTSPTVTPPNTASVVVTAQQRILSATPSSAGPTGYAFNSYSWGNTPDRRAFASAYKQTTGAQSPSFSWDTDTSGLLAGSAVLVGTPSNAATSSAQLTFH